MSNILIKNGHVLDASNQLDGIHDIYIENNIILAVGHAPSEFIADHIIDAKGLFVTAGLVDLSARLREPGFEYKATLKSELQAAVAGGVTSLACPPDTDPPLDESGLVEMLKHRSEKMQLAHVYPIGALTKQLKGQAITEMFELTEAGCIGFSQAHHAITDTEVMWRAFEYAATFGYTLFLDAEDPYLARSGVAHDGEIASRLGLKGIPSIAESIALGTMLRIARETKAKVHFCRLSTAEGVDLIREAKKAGLQVTADVSIQHLHLTDMDIGYFNTHARLSPPLRSQRDRDALSAGVKDGTIDAICSDHSPVDEDAKILPFAEAEAGASALELLLPLALKWAQSEKVPLSKLMACINTQPAAILSLKSGQLAPQKAADLVIFDPEEFWRIEPGALRSQGKNTPFLGMEVPGVVHYTIIDGNIAFKR